MKIIQLSSAQLAKTGAAITIHKEDSIKSAEHIFEFEVANWNDNLTLFRKSAPLVLSPDASEYSEYDQEFKPQGKFAGNAVKFRRVSEKCLFFSLAVYDKGSDKNTLWVDCSATGKTSEILEQYANGSKVVVWGDFSAENHETFGTKLKLFVKGFTLMGGSKSESATEKATAKKEESFDEIPF